MNEVREWVPELPFTENERTSGFLDIALFEPHDPASEDVFLGIVEVKNVVNIGSEFNSDAGRIRFVRTYSKPLCGIVVGIYVDDAEGVVQRMMGDLKSWLLVASVVWFYWGHPPPPAR
jgi:hypothetical protein